MFLKFFDISVKFDGNIRMQSEETDLSKFKALDKKGMLKSRTWESRKRWIHMLDLEMYILSDRNGRERYLLLTLYTYGRAARSY